MVLRFDFPRKWDELTDAQVRRLAPVAFGRKRLRGRALLLYVVLVLGVSGWQPWRFLKLMWILTQVPLSGLQAYVEWAFTADGLTRFPRKLRAGRRLFYGPKIRMQDATIAEFSVADAMYYKWIATGDDRYLNMFVAALYRPREAKRRAPFAKVDLSERAERMEKVALNKKLAVALAFAGTRQYIEKRYTLIFPKRKKTVSSAGYVPFDAIVRSMAMSERKPLGDYYRAASANLYDFLALFQDEIKYQKELEKKLAK